MPIYENANRWVANEHIDDNTCDPCINNNGKIYKNRADAYADYPDGKGFINCVGAEFGNSCRGTVVKRHGGNNMTPEQVAALEKMRASNALFSAKMFTTVDGPTEKLRIEPVANTNVTALYVYDYIGGYDGIGAMDVVSALAGVTGDVDVHINSGGGSIFEGAAIYTTLMNYSGGTVRSYVDGVAASAASVIAMAGEEIEISPVGTMMVHAGNGAVYGTAQDMRDTADLLDLLTASLAEAYALRAGGTAESWLALMNSGDTWYSAQAALDAGLAHRIGGKATPETEPANGSDILSTLYASFGKKLDAEFLPTAVSAPLDVEGIRNVLKGMFA
jgi:ATP-dependent protease ClpP protease subunit